MSAVAALLLALASCAEDAPAPEVAPVPEPPAPDAPAPAPRIWSAADIAEFAPVPSTRSARVPVPIDPDPAFDRALALLGPVVDRAGGDPTTPWAVIHGVQARGEAFALTTGASAVDWLFSEYAEEFEAGGRTWVRFPTARGETRVEPHADLLLKVMTEVGVDPGRPVVVQGHPHTVADLYRGTVITTWLVPRGNHSSYASPNDMPWSVQAISTWAGPRLRWRATDGTAMDLDALATFLIAVLETESRPLADAMAAGADFEKKGQGIFGYSCGGAHLLQGAATAVAQGRGPPDGAERIRKQVPLLFYRLPRELRIYDAAARQSPQHETRLLVQRLMFTGHFLESASKLGAMGFFVPDAEQKRLIAGAAQQVALTVTALQEQGVFDGLPEIRAKDEQLYLDVVGDAAHALNGLELALGRKDVRY